jgi:hypothetical protein
MRFGGPWGALECEEVPTPVGAECLHCEEPIAEGDQGVLMPYHLESGKSQLVAEHRECFLRGVFGSVAHQRRECFCFGGQGEDPPGMTKREAARAAVAHFLPALKTRRRSGRACASPLIDSV